MMYDEGFEDFEITSTPFRVTVTESEPYKFAQYVTQDVNASVHLTHLCYTPPTSRAEWDTYYATRLASSPSAPSSSADVEFGKSVVSVVAKVRTLLLNGSVASFVIACFPLDSARVAALEWDSRILAAAPPPAPASSLPEPTTVIHRFNDLFDVVVPIPSDIAANLDIRLDVDGSVELEVEGPGQVTFSGEQYSALIPEWMNHSMFRVGAGDEELPADEEDDEENDDDDLSDGEMAEMYQLAR